MTDAERLKRVEDAMRYWVDIALREKDGDSREKYFNRAATYATIATAIRAIDPAVIGK